ncbi:MAG: acetylserotonin O-methyltransferase [Pseudomonadota bacterium]|nr:acetylserotonin O-methyltransferase [Pseudomonadota bacterium]
MATNPFSCIQELSAGYFASRCLHVAAELGVADALGDEPMRIEALATATKSDADALFRILRLLETHGVFIVEDGLVSNTPASSLLRSDHPTSMRDFSRMFGLTLNWRSAELLLDTVRSGEAAAPRAFEGGFWGRLASNPHEGRVFDAAMTAKAMGQIGAILASYNFEAFNHIVDVGGGRGHLIRAILRAHPAATGTLFDLPHVIEAAKADGDEEGRLAFRSGDFFKDALPAADAYILMEVIHDWADAEAAQIIAAVRRSAAAQAKLLLIETEVPETQEPDWSKTLDIVMLTLFAARQRTVTEYRNLLSGSDFELRGTTATQAGITIFEAS